MASVFIFHPVTKEHFLLPLIICTIFFILLFACEIVCFEITATRREREMLRYQQVEHPRRAAGDSYIDYFS